jgi:hypothetical protein
LYEVGGTWASVTTCATSINYVLTRYHGDPRVDIHNYGKILNYQCTPTTRFRRISGRYVGCILTQLGVPLCGTRPVHTLYRDIIYPNHILTRLVVISDLHDVFIFLLVYFQF